MGIKELEHLKKSLLDIEGKKLLLIDLKIDYKESNLKINNLQNRIDGVSEFFKSENVMKRTKKLDKLNKRLEKAIRSVQDDISSSNLELKEESRKRVRGILIRILGILFLFVIASEVNEIWMSDIDPITDSSSIGNDITWCFSWLFFLGMCIFFFLSIVVDGLADWSKKPDYTLQGKNTRLQNIEHAISVARFQEEKQKRLAQELPNELGSNEEIRARLEHEIASVEDEINSLYEGIRDLLPYSNKIE